MIRTLFLVVLALATCSANAWAQPGGQSRYGKAERRDPIFLRFPEMAERYWVNTETMAVGRYELLFYVEEYYKAAGVKLSEPAYLDTVPVRIAIFDAKQSYHVPLYFSPWSILSYRGS